MGKGVIIAGAGRGMVFAKLIAAANPVSRDLTVQNCVDWMQLSTTTNTHALDRTVSAVVDTKVESHRRIRAELDEAGLPDARIFATLAEALRVIPAAEADAVMVVTPNATHAELTEMALAAGRHVFLEKPIASNWTDVRRIAAAAAAHPKQVVLLGFVLRYSAFYRRIKEICDGGALGNLVMIQANERLDIPHSSSYRRGWRRKVAATGGALNEKCSHDLDILCWLKEKQAKPAAVFSVGGRELFAGRPELPERCPDCSDRGCPFRLTPEKLRDAKGSFKRDLGLLDSCVYRTDADVNTNQSVTLIFDDGTQAMLTMVMYSGMPGRDIVIHGTGGMLSGCFETGRIELVNYRTGETIDRSIQQAQWHGGGDALVLNDFFDSIDLRGVPVSRLADGVAATRIALAADVSAAEHRVVGLPEFPV
jgi:predicted dehydrogenase